MKQPSLCSCIPLSLAIAIAGACIGRGINATVLDFPGGTGMNSQSGGAVEMRIHPNLRTRSYKLSEAGCDIQWDLNEISLNRGILQSRTVCALPLTEQMPSLSKISRAVLEDPGLKQKSYSLIWGRLTPDKAQDDGEMAFRLALAAHRSPAWDRKRGRPLTAGINLFVSQLANRDCIYPELKGLFASYGFELKISHIEKVLVLKAGELSFFDRLKASGVGADERLPFDCLTYFVASSGAGDPK